VDYDGALRHLRGLEKLGIRFRVENTRELLERMGFDWKGRVVHVSGTNGKGSCASALNSILSEAGYRVGLYTSPELMDFTERIRVAGAQMPKRDFARLTAQLKPLIKRLPQKPTFFEATTALALKYFEEEKADALVLEVGMGGRLDSTNVLPGEASVITNVALDHTQYLGRTVEEIAKEKAGIVSQGSVLVTGAEGGALRVLAEECRLRRAAILRAGQEFRVEDAVSGISGTSFTLRTRTQSYSLQSGLRGLFQSQNLACAAVAAERMGVPKKLIVSGILRARWPGRLDVMQERPLVIVDCAHNPAGLKQARSFIAKTPYGRLIVVAGFSADKDWRQMAQMLSDADLLIATQYGGKRALKAKEILSCVKGEHARDAAAAVKKALKAAGEGDLVFIAGSIYLAGEAMRRWRKRVDI
jgi:dihydrofolate synthase / folylpolyglutamate synthase